MTGHIIVGAGLGGLYTALRLINNGVAPENIVLIDWRAGQYTRPGHLISTKSFERVNQYTGIKTDDHSSARHIKELERQMYHALSNMQVQFIEETFVALQPETEGQCKAVRTVRADGSLGIYPADVVFDCTGTGARVAKAVNDYHLERASRAVFHSTPLSETNPIPHHLIAHVILRDHSSLIDFVPTSRYEQTEPRHYKSATPEKNIETREQLLALGWHYETFPTFYSSPQTNKNKTCLYMETPPDLSVEQRPAWIKLLLNIYSNGVVSDYTELKPSEKYAKKPRIMGFRNVPHQLNRATFESPDLPTIIIGFDALKGFDYRLADGFYSGMECCERMLKHVAIIDGRIHHIDSDAIEYTLHEYIENTYKSRLIEALNSREQSILTGHDYFSDLYARAAAELPVFEHVKKRQYECQAGEIAYRGSMFYTGALELNDDSLVQRIQSLNKYLSSLIKSCQYLPASSTIEHHNINKNLLSVMNSLRYEITQLEVEEIIKDEHISKPNLCSLLEHVGNNMVHLDGTFSCQSIQKKSRELIEQIKQGTSPKNKTLDILNNPAFARFVSGLLDRRGGTSAAFFSNSGHPLTVPQIY